MKCVKVALVITIVITMFSLAGCDEKPTNKDTAESFVKLMLALPNKEIAEVAKLDITAVGSEEFSNKMNKAVESAFGKVVAKEVLADTATSFYNNVVMLHVMAAGKDFTYKTISSKIVELNDKQFSYTAEVQSSNVDDGNIALTGSIQFDDAGKINFVTLK